MVKNLLANAGDMGLIPSPGTKIPNAAGQLSPHATAPESVPWSLFSATRDAATLRSPPATAKRGPQPLQLEKSLRAATEPPKILGANPRPRSEELGSD